MSKPGFRYAVCSLKERRAEIAGEIIQLNLKLSGKIHELRKLDDVIRILDPETNPASRPPKKAIRYLNIFRQGELGRIIVGLLRQGAPMTNLEMARIVMERSGLGENLWTAIRRRTRANLAYLEDQKRVIKIGYGVNAQWALASDNIDNKPKIIAFAR